MYIIFNLVHIIVYNDNVATYRYIIEKLSHKPCCIVFYALYL